MQSRFAPLRDAPPTGPWAQVGRAGRCVLSHKELKEGEYHWRLEVEDPSAPNGTTIEPHVYDLVAIATYLAQSPQDARSPQTERRVTPKDVKDCIHFANLRLRGAKYRLARPGEPRDSNGRLVT